MIVERAARDAGRADEGIDGRAIAALVGHAAGGGFEHPPAHPGAALAADFRSPSRHCVPISGHPFYTKRVHIDINRSSQYRQWRRTGLKNSVAGEDAEEMPMSVPAAAAKPWTRSNQ